MARPGAGLGREQPQSGRTRRPPGVGGHAIEVRDQMLTLTRCRRGPVRAPLVEAGRRHPRRLRAALPSTAASCCRRTATRTGRRTARGARGAAPRAGGGARATAPGRTHRRRPSHPCELFVGRQHELGRAHRAAAQQAPADARRDRRRRQDTAGARAGAPGEPEHQTERLRRARRHQQRSSSRTPPPPCSRSRRSPDGRDGGGRRVPRPRLVLLVLDNCEHLLAAGAACATSCCGPRGLTILATSREPLRVAGEVVFRVPSLDIPDPERDLEPRSWCNTRPCGCSRPRRRGGPGFVLDEDNATDVARSASGSTACRWRSSWPPGASARWDQRDRGAPGRPLPGAPHGHASPTRQQTLPRRCSGATTC